MVFITEIMTLLVNRAQIALAPHMGLHGRIGYVNEQVLFKETQST